MSEKIEHKVIEIVLDGVNTSVIEIAPNVYYKSFQGNVVFVVQEGDENAFRSLMTIPVENLQWVGDRAEEIKGEQMRSIISSSMEKVLGEMKKEKEEKKSKSLLGRFLGLGK